MLSLSCIISYIFHTINSFGCLPLYPLQITCPSYSAVPTTVPHNQEATLQLPYEEQTFIMFFYIPLIQPKQLQITLQLLLDIECRCLAYCQPILSSLSQSLFLKPIE